MAEKIVLGMDNQTHDGFAELQKDLRAVTTEEEKATLALKYMNIELSRREAEKFAAEVKKLADELDGTAAAAEKTMVQAKLKAKLARDEKEMNEKLAVQEKARNERTKKLWESVQALNAGLEISKKAWEAIKGSVTALADRGVPAFEQLNALGRDFYEELLKIGENADIQIMIEKAAIAIRMHLLPAIGQIATGIVYATKKMQDFLTFSMMGYMKLGYAMGLISKQYMESLMEEQKAQEDAHNKRLQQIEEENAKRVAAHKLRLEERVQEMLDPGKKMKADNVFRMQLDEMNLPQAEVARDKKKAEVAARLKVIRQNDPDKDPTGDKTFMDLQAQLVQIEAKLIELDKKDGEAGFVRFDIRLIDEQIQARKERLKVLGAELEADAELNAMIARRIELEAKLLELLVEGDRHQKKAEADARKKRDDTDIKEDKEKHDAEKRQREQNQEKEEKAQQDHRQAVEQRKKELEEQTIVTRPNGEKVPLVQSIREGFSPAQIGKAFVDKKAKAAEQAAMDEARGEGLVTVGPDGKMRGVDTVSDKEKEDFAKETEKQANELEARIYKRKIDELKKADKETGGKSAEDPDNQEQARGEAAKAANEFKKSRKNKDWGTPKQIADRNMARAKAKAKQRGSEARGKATKRLRSGEVSNAEIEQTVTGMTRQAVDSAIEMQGFSTVTAEAFREMASELAELRETAAAAKDEIAAGTKAAQEARGRQRNEANRNRNAGRP